jgi:CDP-diacylglycerol--glycerol-3-phosphate 3-phosphatidyltransferase
MNLANKLTVARIFLTIFFVMAMLLPQFPYGKTIALALFIAASLTDWWDGRIARRTNTVTNFGALLDPLADKILLVAAFICLLETEMKSIHQVQIPPVQAWMVLIIVSREFVITGLRMIAAQRGVAIPADLVGKHKTVSQMVTVIFALVGLAVRDDFCAFGGDVEKFNGIFSTILFYMMLVTVLLTLISGLVYLYRHRELYLRDV